MAMVPSADNGRAAHGVLHAYAASADPDGAGFYVTNEVFLYRLVGVATGDTGEMVEIEDCYSLDIVRVPIDQLQTRRLRVVTASAGPSGLSPDGPVCR